MDVIFNLFKVKYTKLDEIITKSCPKLTRNSKVNLFINIEPILKKLLSSNIIDYLKVNDKNRIQEMISNLINLAAHYRLFFTKNNLYSKVFLYMNHPFKGAYKNKNVNQEYRKYYNEKYSKNLDLYILTDTIDNSIPFAKIILEYIEGTYLITSNTIESSVIPYIIDKHENRSDTVNFILTKDKYEYQYVNHGFYIINPKQDESYIINKDNMISNLKIDNKIYNDLTIDSYYYAFIYSLLGDKYRNINKIKSIGLSGILKTINKALETNVIGPNVYNINILSNIIKSEYRPLLLSNFYCCDIETQYQMLNIQDLYSITNQLTDKFDNVQLKKINDEFFKTCPIYLLELMSAAKLKQVKKDIFTNK